MKETPHSRKQLKKCTATRILLSLHGLGYQLKNDLVPMKDDDYIPIVPSVDEINEMISDAQEEDYDLLGFFLILALCKRGHIDLIKDHPIVKQIQKDKKQIVCKTIKGPEWINNSCYIDSVLMILFAVPYEEITTHFLEKDLATLPTNQQWSIELLSNRERVQKILLEMTHDIRHGTIDTCSPLRKALSYCDLPQPFHKGGKQDASEFLIYLFTLFQVDTAKMERVTKGADSQDGPFATTSTLVDGHTIPVIDILPPKKYNDKVVSLSLFLKQEVNEKLEDWKYAYRQEITTYTDASFLIFNVRRLQEGNRFSKFPIAAPNKMKLESGKVLHWRGVVCHNGTNHYVCFLKCNDEWYFFNDMKSKSLKLVTLDDVQEYSCEHGTLFFYV